MKKHLLLFSLMMLLTIAAIGQKTVNGTITDEFGETLIGVNILEKGTTNGSLGFDVAEDTDNTQYERISTLVNEELKNYFRPEFLNRLDEIIIFSQLTKDDVGQIAEIMIKQLSDRVLEQGIRLQVTERVKEKLTDEGFNPIYGARPLRRAVMRLLEDNLAGQFLTEELKPGTTIIVDLDDNKEISIFVSEVEELTKVEDDSEVLNT